MEHKITTPEEQFWQCLFWSYFLEFGLFSNIMMQQIGGI